MSQNKLYQSVQGLGLSVTHVAEVGVYLPETSNVIDFMEAGCKTDLFEPDPEMVEKIHARFDSYSNVSIHPYAIYHECTRLGLYRTNSSTFAQSLSTSPALVNDRYQPNVADLFYVDARLFSEFDDGTIDVLSIDTEGCEWYVLKHLVSRPTIISIETHGKDYTNPYLADIELWMVCNDYKVWYRNKSDTVYIRSHLRPSWLKRLLGKL